METLTITYTKLLGAFYLQGWFGNQPMDSHMAGMLSEGWKIAGSTDEELICGSGARLTRINTTYKK